MGKVLITGGSGRFAKYMAQVLRDKYEVVLFSRTQPPKDRADLPWVEGDLNSYDDCVKAVQGVDVIHHLGAVPWPSDHEATRERIAAAGRAVPPWDQTMKTNIMGTYYLMKAAVDAGVKTVVMTGSNCAFGHCWRRSDRPYPIQYLPLDEKHPSDCEVSYGWSKWAGEQMLAQFSRAFGIRTYVTRPAHISDAETRKRMAENVKPATQWSGGLWGWVASEDLADLQLLIQEAADDLPVHDIFVGNNLDTEALEPTMELIERFRPDLLPVSHGLSGHDALFSPKHAYEMVGWVPAITWRDYLPK